MGLRLNVVRNRLPRRKVLSRHKLGPLAIVDSDCRRARTAGNVNRTAHLAIEARDLSGVWHETDPSRRHRRQPVRIDFLDDTKYPRIAFEPNS